MARKGPVGRRGFLKGAAGAAAGAAALATSTPAAKAQAPERAATPLPSTALAAAEKSPPTRGDVSAVDVYTTDRPGADFMVDVIKTITSAPILGPASADCMNRWSTTAAIRLRSSSPAATKNRRWPWRTATSRSKVSR